MVAKEQQAGQFGLKFAGEFLSMMPPSVVKDIEDNIPQDDARWRVRSRNRPGRNSGLTFNLDPEPVRPIKFYQLHYPNTAMKWSEFFFVATKDELRRIEAKCFTSENAVPQTLEMWTQDDRKLTVNNMYLLPPRPYRELGPTNPTDDLFICCLVDDI